MKIKHINSRVFVPTFVLLFLTLAILFAPEKNDQIIVNSSYPATVCPAIGNKVSSIASLADSKIKRRLVDGSSRIISSGKRSTILLSNDALLVEGNENTALTFTNNNWKSVVPCSISNGMQWFIGGSGSLVSKSSLYIVNSGFSESVVDLEIFTPDGELGAQSVAVAQNSTRKLSLDSLIPGEDIIAIGVKTKSGRVSSYLFDERKKGLRSLGADFVAPVGFASKTFTISAISGLSGKLGSQGNSVSHSMRVLTPGDIDANISVTINSNDGNFIPVGLDELNIKSKRVVSVPLTFAPLNQAFSIIITSDQPILASVLSTFNYGKRGEIAWATGSDQLVKWSANLAGSRPTLAFSGKNIDIAISATGVNGRKITSKVKGTNFAVWNAPVGLNRLQITANKGGSSGGLIFLPEIGNIGSSYIPLNNGANLETAPEPVADASVITRG